MYFSTFSLSAHLTCQPKHFARNICAKNRALSVRALRQKGLELVPFDLDKMNKIIFSIYV